MRLRCSVVAAPVAAAWIVLSAITPAAASSLSLGYSPDSSPWSLAPGEHYAEISGSSMATESYYDSAATRVLLVGRAQERAVRSHIDLGWKPRWSVQLSLPLVTHSLRSTSPTGLGVTQTGLEDFGVGFRFRIANGGTASSLQLRWEAPTGYNSKLTPSLGNGLQKLSVGLQAGSSLGRGSFWQAGAGLRYEFLGIAGEKRVNKYYGSARPVAGADDWATHALIDAAYAQWLGRVQLAGVYHATLHVASGRPYKVAQMGAGPRVTYRVDERLDAFAGSWHTPWGRNTLHFDEYYAGIAWRSTKLSRLQGFLGGDRRP